MRETLEQMADKLETLSGKMKTFEARTPSTVIKSQVRLEDGKLIPGIVYRERMKEQAAAKKAARKKPGPKPGAKVASPKA